MEFERTLEANKRRVVKENQMPNVNITVSIPATLAGYTGQRDEYESTEQPLTVTYTDGKVTLTANRESVAFSKVDLDAALRALGQTDGPVYR